MRRSVLSARLAFVGAALLSSLGLSSLGLGSLGLGSLGLGSCGREEASPPPEYYGHIADSAAVAAWHGEALMLRDTMAEGRFYDSIYVHVLPAVRIELARREIGAKLAADSLLELRALANAAGRSNSLKRLGAAYQADSTLRDSIGDIASSMRDFLKDFGKQRYPHDNAQQQALLRRMNSRWFVPAFRLGYDSVERSVYGAYEELIRHMESTSHRARIDTAVHFLEDSDRISYARILYAIDLLRKREESYLGSSGWKPEPR